uniref:Uncharacterized protein n=1 Tax=Parascaris univalens TaxID=6257 RepID=A0A915A4M5_PARUN
LHTNEGMVYVDLYVVEWHLLDSGLAKYLYTASTHKKIASWSTYQRHPFLLKYGVPSMEITFERSRQTKTTYFTELLVSLIFMVGCEICD